MVVGSIPIMRAFATLSQPRLGEKVCVGRTGFSLILVVRYPGWMPPDSLLLRSSHTATLIATQGFKLNLISFSFTQEGSRKERVSSKGGLKISGDF